MTDRVCRRATIRGRVQGVGFRDWTWERATRLGLAGRVRNMPDGSVVAELVGPPETVETMLDACREGPPSARVDAVEYEAITPVPDLHGFEITA